MSKPYDATTKFLLETFPSDWLRLLGLPVAPVEILDADLSTVTAAADRVFRPLTSPSYLLHLELQAGYLATLDERTLFQNVSLMEKYHWPVLSVLVLLHRQANSPQFTEKLERFLPDGRRILEFQYRVVRVWELDVEALLSGGLGTLPLAPLANVSEAALAEVIHRMEARIEAEMEAGKAAELWTATYILMGLSTSKELARELLKGVRNMRESSTYQEILQEGREVGREEGREVGREEGREVGREEGREVGREEEARRLLLKLGARRLGTPLQETADIVNSMTDLARLETWIERLLDVESWDELLNEEI